MILVEFQFSQIIGSSSFLGVQLLSSDELIINTLVWRELQTDSNGYLQGSLKVPWWAANKILGFAITYGYDDSLNISERQKLKQARNKIILKGVEYATLRL